MPKGEIYCTNSKPTVQGGVQVLDEVETDVEPLRKCQVKRKERAKHWQCNTKVQDLKDKHWRNEGLQSLEEGLPSQREAQVEMESARCGTHCWTWKDLTAVREKKTRDHAGALAGNSLRAGQFSSCVGLGDALQLPKEDIAGATRVPCSLKYASRSRSRKSHITAVLPGSKWSWLLLRVVLRDALSEVMKVYPLLKLRVFVDFVTVFMEEKNKELPSIAAKMLKSSGREVEEKGLKSITEGGREEQNDCVMQLPG